MDERTLPGCPVIRLLGAVRHTRNKSDYEWKDFPKAKEGIRKHGSTGRKRQDLDSKGLRAECRGGRDTVGMCAGSLLRQHVMDAT